MSLVFFCNFGSLEGEYSHHDCDGHQHDDGGGVSVEVLNENWPADGSGHDGERGEGVAHDHGEQRVARAVRDDAPEQGFLHNRLRGL